MPMAIPTVANDVMSAGSLWIFGDLTVPFEVTIENKDFEALIKQYDRPNAFYLLRSPYYDAEGFYAVAFPKADHIRLRDALKKAQVMLWSATTIPQKL